MIQGVFLPVNLHCRNCKIVYVRCKTEIYEFTDDSVKCCTFGTSELYVYLCVFLRQNDITRNPTARQKRRWTRTASLMPIYICPVPMSKKSVVCVVTCAFCPNQMQSATVNLSWKKMTPFNVVALCRHGCAITIGHEGIYVFKVGQFVDNATPDRDGGLVKCSSCWQKAQ